MIFSAKNQTSEKSSTCFCGGINEDREGILLTTTKKLWGSFRKKKKFFPQITCLGRSPTNKTRANVGLYDTFPLKKSGFRKKTIVFCTW